jgi:hypothetical protein
MKKREMNRAKLLPPLWFKRKVRQIILEISENRTAEFTQPKLFSGKGASVQETTAKVEWGWREFPNSSLFPATKLLPSSVLDWTGHKHRQTMDQV